MIRTWHIETIIVAFILGIVVVITGSRAYEWIGAGAVLLTFGHVSVAERLAERDAIRERPSVDCHRWTTRYLIGKETLWAIYFVANRTWSALAGVGLFLLYTPWRRYWRQRHPMPAQESLPKQPTVDPVAVLRTYGYALGRIVVREQVTPEIIAYTLEPTSPIEARTMLTLTQERGGDGQR